MANALTLRLAIFVASVASFPAQATLGQTNLPKVVDTTHHFVVAIHRIDSTGTSHIMSGVLIHPQVLLTAGHVLSVPQPGWTLGFVSRADHGRDITTVDSFDVSRDAEVHQDFEKFNASLADSTGAKRSTDFLDIGLLFLKHPLQKRAFAQLPEPSILTRAETLGQLIGVGYGYHRIADSTFTPHQTDGVRRQWIVPSVSLLNDSWVSTQCDTLSPLPLTGVGDSGGSLLLGNSVVVGIWSMTDDKSVRKPCVYTSLAVRIDNPVLLNWIKNQAKKRLGIDLN